MSNKSADSVMPTGLTADVVNQSHHDCISASLLNDAGRSDDILILCFTVEILKIPKHVIPQTYTGLIPCKSVGYVIGLAKRQPDSSLWAKLLC